MNLEIRQDVRREQDDRGQTRNSEERGGAQRIAAEPVARAGHDGKEKQPGREYQQVDRGQRLQRERDAEEQRVLPPARCERGIEREERERDELDVLRLQMRQTDKDVRIERRQTAGDVRGRQAAGPAEQEKPEGPPRERK